MILSNPIYLGWACYVTPISSLGGFGTLQSRATLALPAGGDGRRVREASLHSHACVQYALQPQPFFHVAAAQDRSRCTYIRLQ